MKKTKFRNADIARTTKALNADWTKLLNKWGVEGGKKRGQEVDNSVLTYSLSPPPRGPGARIASLGSAGGAATVRPSPRYTGDKMLGIGVLHKSNCVPIFSDSDARDLSSMRR